MDPDEDELRPLARALGDLLAVHRHAAGLTQRQLADAIAYSRVTIACAETGSRMPSKAFWKGCERTLSAGGVLMRLYEQHAGVREIRKREGAAQEQAERDARVTARPPVYSIPSASPVPTFTADLPVHTHENSVSNSANLARRNLGADPLDTGFSVLRGFSAALGSAASTDTPSTYAGGLSDVIKEVKQTAISHRQAYRYLSHEVLLPQALAHIDAVVSLRPGAQPPPLRVSLISTLGEMAALVGTLSSLDMRDFQHGSAYLSMAITAAQESNNTDLLAFTLGARAFHAAYSGHLADGIDFAEGGISEGANGASSTTRAWLAAVASELHATNNDDYRCRTLLDSAKKNLHEDDGQTWVGIGVFDGSKLRAYRGGNLNRLGRHKEAQVELTDALSSLPETAFKHRATASIDLAEAHLPLGGIEEACHWGIHALELTAQTQHAGSLERIKVLYRRARTVSRDGAAI